MNIELRDKKILLIVGGGIAAYKSLELLRRLREQGASVQVILTAAGKKFVSPLSFSALGGAPAREDLFDAAAESGAETSAMGHIELARFCDVIIVAPATADLLARMATGLADDLATATLLASDAPLLLAPAMNPHMWSHPATRRNLERLQSDGASVVGPDEGDTACGEVGVGRMAEVAAIVQAAAALTTPSHKPLAGRKALVTAGPTIEAIDSLRFLSNRSSGRQGRAIAAALAQAGAQTLLVQGPCAQTTTPSGVRTIEVESAGDMLAACESALPVDIAVMTAAVGDWRASEIKSGKMRKDGSGAPILLELQENPDILEKVSRRERNRPRLVVGFAAESGTPEEILERARAKRQRKGCDWIAANSIDVMGKEETVLQLIASSNKSAEEIAGDKESVARELVERIATALPQESKT